MPRLLLIDNYDSFVYNLAQVFGSLGADITVMRNDVALEDLVRTEPDAVVVSPGPGEPGDAGISERAIGLFAGKVPLLGVCLGHQCIGSVFGAKVDRAPVGPRHGKVAQITHDGSGVFRGLPSPLSGTSYHSLVIDEASLPDELVPTAWSEDGTLMGVRHAELPVEGVQFHPESILCDAGHRILENFLTESAKAPAT